jgi:hypothetical protein
MERLSAVLGQTVQFVYTCWDRIVLNGYLERLQRPECPVHFFHDVLGIACIEPAALEQRTSRGFHTTREGRDILVTCRPGGAGTGF